MTLAEASKRQEFQKLRQTAMAFSSALRLVTRAYGVELNLIDPKITAEVVIQHAVDEVNKRAVLARLSSADRVAIGVLNLRKLKE